jgi:hypothetical protein
MEGWRGIKKFTTFFEGQTEPEGTEISSCTDCAATTTFFADGVL